MNALTVAAVQMVSSDRVDDNLERARHWVREAAAQGAQFVALPEYFCLMDLHEEGKLAIAEPDGDGPLQRFLAGLARDLGITLLGGTVPLRSAVEGKVHNSSLVYGPDGRRLARYDKLHLFGFDNGRERYDEGRLQQAGMEPVGLDWQGLRVGLSVCYDLRFPELYRQLASELICVPSAFTHTTGQAHWELLLRARAVENLAYVLAPAQGGLHANGRRTWGHSMLIDPWGQVLACVPEGEGLALGVIERERLAQVRRQLPALQHRRLA